jgi:CheY-like chemotaxis protein
LSSQGHPTTAKLYVVSLSDAERHLLQQTIKKGKGSARTTCQVAESVVPDLCLIDIMLSTTSGIEVAAELRDCGFVTTPLVAMSASSLMTQYAVESGLFQRVIEKPLDLDELVIMIDEFLEPDQERDA